jgi:phenylacetate-CoA ligase
VIHRQEGLITLSKLGSTLQRVVVHTPESWMGPIARVHGLARRRFRRTVSEWHDFLENSEHWSREGLHAYAIAQLRDLLTHAYQHVPYYRAVFDDLGGRPEDIRRPEDLRSLPMLSKRELQNQQEALLASNVRPRDRVYSTTGGSTGEPVGFFHDRDTSAKEWAFMMTQWGRAGYREGDRAAILRGTVVRGERLFERAPFQNALIMSSYHLTEDRLPHYLATLRQFRPRFLRAYPSAATIVARFMREREEPPVRGLEAVLCGSENLYDWQRREIEEAFGCRVFSWYGQSERVCLAGECEHDTRLHIFPQYGITELIDERGNPVEEPGRLGEIVATGFLNRAMPLIRYRTADVASFAQGTCEACGRLYELFERVEGRLQEFIVSRSGRYISMTAINMHSPVFDNVHQFRFRQSVPGEVVLSILPKAAYTPATDEPRIRSELAPKLGSDLDLELEVVTEIPNTSGGKFRFLDQELPGPFERT